ncbi:MAG: hypothetical protein ABIV51_07090, partial [Saprospiraceae bacterium]
MKLPRKLFPYFIVASVLCCLAAATAPKWGFFAHKRINQLAVFTLPPELIVFYKQHIGYITDHATDPDKRRYAVQGEAIRHFIDLDQWGKPPFAHLSRDLEIAVVQEGAMFVISSTNDTLLLYTAWPDSIGENRELSGDASTLKAALTIQ